MTRKNRKNRNLGVPQEITLNEAKTVIKGINRLDMFETKLKTTGTIPELKLVIFDAARSFEKADFGDDGFNEEEKAVLKKLAINTYEKKVPKSKEKKETFTRSDALVETLRNAQKAETKINICKEADRLFREKNPDSKGLTYDAAIKDGKVAVSEVMFRYNIPTLMALGIVSMVGKGEIAVYRLSIPKV